MKFNKLTSQNINDFDNKGYTPLGRACEDGDIRLVKKILKIFPQVDLDKGCLMDGAIINTIDIACENSKIMAILMEHNLGDKEKTTMFRAIALNEQLSEIFKAMGFGDSILEFQNELKHNYSKALSSSLNSSIKHSKPIENISNLQNSLHQLKNSGFKVDIDKNPLHKSIMEDKIEITKVIIENESLLIDQPNSNGQTSLHYAARKGSNEILKLLLPYSQNPHVLDIKGYSPLDYAIKEGHISTVKQLIAYGFSYSKYENIYLTALNNNDQKKIDHFSKYIKILNDAKSVSIDKTTQQEDVKESADSLKVINDNFDSDIDYYTTSSNNTNSFQDEEYQSTAVLGGE